MTACCTPPTGAGSGGIEISPGTPDIVEIHTGEVSNYHGYVRTPRSRVLAAHEHPELGAKVPEPQSIETYKGYPAYERYHNGHKYPLPPDGKLASAGIAPYAPLDGAKAPNGQDWPAMAVSPGGTLRMHWWLTQPHKTEKWHYYVTKDGWDPSKPLARGMFEELCTIHWHTDPATADWKAPTPIQDVHHWIKLPNKQGRHVIFAVWDIADTQNAFYQVVDVEFDARKTKAMHAIFEAERKAGHHPQPKPVHG